MQMPMPDDWDGLSVCRWAVCWPSSPKWQAILSGLIEMPNQGRFWDFSTGDFLDLREQFKPVYDYNFELKGVLMSCEDTGIADALNAIAAAIMAQAQATITTSAQSTAQSANCCGTGSAGAGQHSPPFDPIDPPTDPEGPPPDGFETWDQYRANRCSIATDIITKARQSVANMRLINLIGLTLVSIIPVLIGLLVDPVPGDEIAVIGAVLLGTLAFGTAIIDSVLSTIDNHFDELVCALYENGSAAFAESNVEAKFSEVYDDDWAGVPYAFGAKQLFNSLIGANQTNRLLVLNTALSLPEGDCSDCEETTECFFFDDNLQGFFAQEGSMPNFYSPPGTTVTWDSGEMVMTSVVSGGTSYAFAWSPEISHLIVEGDVLCIEITLIDHVSFSSYVAAVIDGVDTALDTSSGAETERNYEISLDTYAGQTITSFSFGWGKSGAFVVNIGSAGINCPACAE